METTPATAADLWTAIRPFINKDSFAVVFAFLAFVVSIITLRLQSDDRLRTLRAQISDTIGKLLSAEVEAGRLNAEISKPNLDSEEDRRLRAERWRYNELRFSLAQVATYFMSNKRCERTGFIVEAEYAAVARALSDNKDLVRAREHWEKAIGHSQPGVYKMRLTAFYAEFLFSNIDREEGRRQYAKSLELDPQPSDSLHWEAMYNCLKWAKSEARVGETDQVAKLVASAEKMCSAIKNIDLAEDGKRNILPRERTDIERIKSKALEHKLNSVPI
jgi:tetratricopeptide (TPR) repeat protein